MKLSQYFLVLFVNLFISFNCFAAVAADPVISNSDEPVNITSDTLEVLQNQKQAIFKGSVEAIQGNMNLRSDKMVVHYKEGKNKDYGSENNSVSKIIATGNVFLSTPAETAKGKEGVYDVDKSLLTLSGGVTITKGKNIVKGDGLVYDLNSKTSKLVSSVAKKDGNGRVSGVFVPEKKNKE